MRAHSIATESFSIWVIPPCQWHRRKWWVFGSYFHSLQVWCNSSLWALKLIVGAMPYQAKWFAGAILWAAIEMLTFVFAITCKHRSVSCKAEALSKYPVTSIGPKSAWAFWASKNAWFDLAVVWLCSTSCRARDGKSHRVATPTCATGTEHRSLNSLQNLPPLVLCTGYFKAQMWAAVKYKFQGNNEELRTSLRV